MKRTLIIIAFVILLGVPIALRLRAKQAERRDQAKAQTARKNAAPNVTVATATQRDVIHQYQAVGSVESPFNIRIASKITGRIDYLQKREGDRVTPGELLVRMDPSEVQGQVEQQRANIAEAQARLAQAQLTTNSTNVGVTTGIAQQVAAVNSAQADYKQVRVNYQSQIAAARATVTDAQGRVDAATSAIRNAEATIRSAQANLDNARVRYNRTNDLYKQGFVAAQDVDDARTTVNVQQGALDVATAQRVSAQSSRDSALAQKQSAQEQLDIVIVKGKADIAASLARLNQAKASLTLARANTSQKPAYQANLQALQSAVQAANGQLANAQAQLANTTLESSIDGYVTSRTADPGTTVSAGTTILTLVSLKQVYVTTTIPEEISRFVRQGMAADVTLDALPGRTFQGKVTQAAPAADPQSRQFTIRVTLDNPQGEIKPGQFGRVTIITERFANQIVVPREAVKNGKDGQTAIVIDGQNVAHVRKVKTGPDDGGNIAVVEGIKAGEKVVTLSAAPVKDGQKVKIAGEVPVNAPAPPNTGGGGAPAPTAAAGGGGGGSSSSSAGNGSTVSGANGQTGSNGTNGTGGQNGSSGQNSASGSTPTVTAPVNPNNPTGSLPTNGNVGGSNNSTTAPANPNAAGGSSGVSTSNPTGAPSASGTGSVGVSGGTSGGSGGGASGGGGG